MRELTDLPIIVDPSHAAGMAAWVPPLASAALAVGADGLMVEAHPRPRESWCDPDQALSLEELKPIVRWVQATVRPQRWLVRSVCSSPGCRSTMRGVGP